MIASMLVYWKRIKHYICSVKFAVLIFAFYMLLLPGIPCTEAAGYSEAASTKIIHSSGEDTDHQHESEACSPCCNCTCCGHVFIPGLQGNKIAWVKPLTKQKLHCFYNNSMLSSCYFGNIWQPPKPCQ